MKIDLVCKNCGKIYNDPAYRVERSKYCSNDCKYDSMRKNYNEFISSDFFEMLNIHCSEIVAEGQKKYEIKCGCCGKYFNRLKKTIIKGPSRNEFWYKIVWCDSCGNFGIRKNILDEKFAEHLPNESDNWKYSPFYGEYPLTHHRHMITSTTHRKNKEFKFNIKVDEVENKHLQQNRDCAICKCRVSFDKNLCESKGYQKASIDRISSENKEYKNNFQVTCIPCNLMRWDFPVEKFVAVMILIAKKQLGENMQKVSIWRNEDLYKIDNTISRKNLNDSVYRWKSRKPYEFKYNKFEIQKMIIDHNYACKLTGISLTPENLSLDRINSDIEEYLNNTQIVHKDVNVIKREFTESFLITKSKIIYELYQNNFYDTKIVNYYMNNYIDSCYDGGNCKYKIFYTTEKSTEWFSLEYATDFLVEYLELDKNLSYNLFGSPNVDYKDSSDLQKKFDYYIQNKEILKEKFENNIIEVQKLIFEVEKSNKNINRFRKELKQKNEQLNNFICSLNRSYGKKSSCFPIFEYVAGTIKNILNHKSFAKQKIDSKNKNGEFLCQVDIKNLSLMILKWNKYGNFDFVIGDFALSETLWYLRAYRNKINDDNVLDDDCKKLIENEENFWTQFTLFCNKTITESHQINYIELIIHHADLFRKDYLELLIRFIDNEKDKIKFSEEFDKLWFTNQLYNLAVQGDRKIIPAERGWGDNFHQLKYQFSKKNQNSRILIHDATITDYSPG